jgi:hypothetical protein
MSLHLPKFAKFLGFVLAWFLSIFYLLLIPYAVSKQGDFVHLWIGGRAVLLGGGAYLYNPESHLEILQSTGYPVSAFWGAGHALIGAFYYPPPAILWYAPLALFPLATAQAIQAVVTWALVLVCGFLISNLAGKRLSLSWSIALLFLSPPVFHSFALGQNGVMSLSIILGAFWLEKLGRPYAAGATLALFSYKPTWLGSVIWYPVVPWRPRVLLSFTLGILALTLLSAAFVGLRPFAEFFSLLGTLFALPQLPGYSYSTQCSVAALARALFRDPSVAFLISSLVAAFAVILSSLVLKRGHKTTKDSSERFALVLLCASCVTPHLHHYDLTLAWAAMLLVFASVDWRDNRNLGVLIPLFALWATSFYLDPVRGVQPVTITLLIAFLAVAIMSSQKKSVPNL